MFKFIARACKKEKIKKEKNLSEKDLLENTEVEKNCSRKDICNLDFENVLDQRVFLKSYFNGLFNFGFKTTLPDDCEIFFKNENQVFMTNLKFSYYKNVDLNKDKKEVLNFIKKLAKDYSLEKDILFETVSKNSKTINKFERTIQSGTADYQIFTDGSKFHNELNPSLSKVGGAYFIYDKFLNKKKSGYFRLSNKSLVVEAELTAVYLAIHYLISINSKNKDIEFFLDCQEAIFLLNSKDFKSSNYKLSDSFAKMIEVLRKKNLSLYFKWVKGHSSILQNEIADQKAKEAANLPYVTFNKKIYFKI